MYVGTLTMPGSDYRLPPPAELQETMIRLKKVLLTNLRNGDVFSQWNDSQFGMLLSGMSLEQAERILRRFDEKFGKNYFKELVIPRWSLHPILSSE